MPDAPNQDELNQRAWEDPSHWRWGLFYYSEADSRGWVPKRSLFGRRRFGGTPNFAQKSARQYMMIMVGVMLLFLLIVISLERWGVLP